MMAHRKLVFGISSLAAILVGGHNLRAAFPPPTTADPIDGYTVNGLSYQTTNIASGDGTQSFTDTLLYDANYNPNPDVYWFKYVSDGKTAVTFDTLGSNFGTNGPNNSSGGGAVLGAYNDSEIAVYNSSGTSVAITKGTVDSSGNPIPIYPTFDNGTDSTGTDWYTPEGLSQLYFEPNPASDPMWDANPNDPTG